MSGSDVSVMGCRVEVGVGRCGCESRCGGEFIVG